MAIQLMYARAQFNLSTLIGALEDYLVPAKNKAEALLQQIYNIRLEAKERKKEEKREKENPVSDKSVSAPEPKESVEDKIGLLKQMNDQVKSKQEQAKRKWFK